MSEFDVIAIGRSGLDLYAEQVGSPFERIESFAAYVGGTPANVAVGTRRLGLRSALSTAVSDDPVGDFVLEFLSDEGVDTRFISRKPGTKTGMTLLGITPPDRFPRLHFRENGADLRQTIADVAEIPMATARSVLVVGTSLCASPGREATLFAAEQARHAGAMVVLDLDYRADLWPDPLSYAVSVRALVRLCHTAIGTEEEIRAASAPLGGGAVRSLFELGPEMIVEKRGPRGSRIHHRDERAVDVPGFQVAVQNTLGAGDAFASGFLYSTLRGNNSVRAARFGNACGAIVVGRHACSASCPTFDEVMLLIESQGGF